MRTVEVGELQFGLEDGGFERHAGSRKKRGLSHDAFSKADYDYH
jgi:hypothetical protein